MTLWIVMGVVILLAIYAIVTYNKLILYTVQTENAWSQIDVQLKRRHDLIPNLVETVKGIMKFEKDTLTQVVEARTKAVGAKDMESRIKAEGEISGLLGRLFAVWENYPDLKSNKNAMMLQEELSTTENRIAYARGYYNDITTNLKALVMQFPSNLIAGIFNIKWKFPFFELAEPEKKAPEVKF